MQIAVQCYGVTSRLAGASSLMLQLAESSALADRYQALAPTLPRCACALGDVIVKRTAMLNDGDELALLPPVAGG
ncbi:MAG: MoaD/ThiS family protein [Pseudomonadota bacterium]|nr:MoaD/ThiS family protein [Pseudomonadota bacterium]